MATGTNGAGDSLRSSIRSFNGGAVGGTGYSGIENCTVVHEGWLTKSPPEKRIWKAKWRQRYFVLKQGQIPGQFLLEYFEDAKCKKLRGRINLDECEQVDAGLSLNFESGGKASKFVFDIKTPQRLYYLATKTEEEMKQWVDCICSCCGLKIQDGIVAASSAPDDYRYSPNPSSDQSNSGTTVTTAMTTGNGVTLAPSGLTLTNDNGHSRNGSTANRVTSVASSSASPLRLSNSNGRSAKSGSNLLSGTEPIVKQQPRSISGSLISGAVKSLMSNADKKSSNSRSSGNQSAGIGVGDEVDNPYIPISECRSGCPKGSSPTSGIPTINISTATFPKSTINLSDKPKSGLQMLNTQKFSDGSLISNTNQALMSESYDIPRLNTFVPLNSRPAAGNVSKTASTRQTVDDLLYVVPKPSASPLSFEPPGVNWKTLPNPNQLGKRAIAGRGNPNALYAQPNPQAEAVQSAFNPDDVSRASVRSCSASFESSATNPRTRTDSGKDRNRNTLHTDLYLNTCPDGPMSMDGISLGVPPPRPPKPATLRRRRGHSESDSSLPDTDNEAGRLQDDADGSDTSKVIPTIPENVLKTSDTNREPLLGRKVPLPKNKGTSLNINNNNELKVDEMYCFPRPVEPNSAMVPTPSGSSLHAYFNAAPGRCRTGNKDNIFNYEFGPSLPSGSSILTSAIASSDHCGNGTPPDTSPRTPCQGAPLGLGVVPPPPNRNLKPRRQSASSSASMSPKDHATAVAHNRKSAQALEKQKRKEEGLELQYLDLDLDSSDGSSPRTPNLDNGTAVHGHGSKVTSSPSTRTVSEAEAAAAKSSSSVYKEVDFVRTDALNKMRGKTAERIETIKAVH